MIIVFDTEATDLVPGQLCQLSYLMIEGESVTGKNMFFAVDEMNPSAQEVHGFSIEELDELSGGDRFYDRADEIVSDFERASMIIGHNVSADDRYLRVELDRLGISLKKIKTFCTMNYFTGVLNMKRKINTGRPKPPKLEELKDFLEISDEEIEEKAAKYFGGGMKAHDARFDTVMTWLCVVKGTEKGMLRGVI